MEEIGAFATYRVYMDGSWEFEPDKYEDETSPKLWDVQFGAKSERVKRPAPEALGADGLPIVEGETVWLDEAHSRCAGSCGFEDGNKYSLCGIERQEMLTVEDAHMKLMGGNTSGFVRAEHGVTRRGSPTPLPKPRSASTMTPRCRPASTTTRT